MNSSRIQIVLPDRYPVKNSPYYNKPIVKRSPYFMHGDLIVPASSSATYPDNTFVHNEDYPFEVTGFIPFITTLDSNSLPQDDPGIGSLRNLYRYVTLNMKFLGIARTMTKAAARLSAMIELGGQVVFDAPIYLVSSQGFDITVNSAITSALAAGGIRMEIQFQGSLLELAP